MQRTVIIAEVCQSMHIRISGALRCTPLLFPSAACHAAPCLVLTQLAALAWAV